MLRPLTASEFVRFVTMAAGTYAELLAALQGSASGLTSARDERFRNYF
jgi:hypothetical protein